MRWVRIQIALFAAAMIVANAQCVVTCATGLCHESGSQSPSTKAAPPCHRHYGPPKPAGGDQSCRHFVFVAEGHARTVVDANPIQAHATEFSDPSINAHPVPRLFAYALAECAVSPHPRPTQLAGVLRI